MGETDSVDLTGLLNLARQYQAAMGPSEDERRMARAQAAILAGLGMIATPRGREFQGIPAALAMGINDYRGGLDAAVQAKRQSLGDVSHLVDMQQKLQAAQEAQRMRAGEQQARALNTIPGMPAMGPPTAQGEMQPPVAPRLNLPGYAESLMAVDPMKGLQLRAALQKETPYDKPKPADYTPQSLSAFAKSGDPRDLVPVNKVETVKMSDGKFEWLANKMTGEQIGPKIPVGMTAAQEASNRIAQEHLNISRSAERRAAAAEGKPQILTTNEGDVLAVNPKTLTGAPVLGPDGLPLNKGQKALTEGQGKNSMYLGMMKSATEQVDKATGLSTTEIALARGDAKYVPQFAQNMMAGEKAQRYVQASLQWTEAMLRITTGATAPPEEVARMSKMFFPQVGDTPELIMQKKAQRDQMEKYVALSTGKGAGQVESILGNQPAASNIPGYDQLPSGAIYTDPQGNKRRKR